jgi:hypothetical protein
MSGISRPKVAAAKIGVGLTKLSQDYVDRGGDPDVPGTEGKVKRLRPVSLGERAIGFFDDEIDGLIEGLRACRDAAPCMPPKPAVLPQFHPSKHRKGDHKGEAAGRLKPTAR